MLAVQPPPTAFQPRLPASSCRSVKHPHTPGRPGGMSACCHSLAYSGANQALEDKCPHWKSIGFQTDQVTSESFLVDSDFVSELLSDTFTSKRFPQTWCGWTCSRDRQGNKPFPHHTKFRHSKAHEVARVIRASTGRITLCQVNVWKMVEDECHTILADQQGQIKPTRFFSLAIWNLVF